MIRVLFVCHGNICRSPMAEFMLKNRLLKEKINNVSVDSAATSTEELGNDMYAPAKRKLKEEGIPFERRSARQIRKSDYQNYDMLIGMDAYNVKNMIRYFGDDPDKKISMLLDRPVADPWYTGDFDATYKDINEGLDILIEKIQSQLY